AKDYYCLVVIVYFVKPCGHCQAVFRLLLLRCQSTKCVDGRDRGFVALSSSKQGQRAFTFARSFKPELKSTGKRTTESNSYIFLFLFSSLPRPYPLRVSTSTSCVRCAMYSSRRGF
ncbi:unnamed protein product, partial [Ixodes persulcatus]